jgi:chromosome segregation ATPase
MSNTRDTVIKVKNLEEEKQNLLAQFEELKKLADMKSKSLENEISTIKDQIESLKAIMGQEQNHLSNHNSLGGENQDSALRIVEKISSESNELGNQIFEFSPYSQYFDSWLVNLQQIISEFELDSDIKLDEMFVKDRSRIFLDIKQTLAQIRLEESKIGINEKALNDNNQLLIEIEKDYNRKIKEIDERKNSEIPRLTSRIHELENQVGSNEEKISKISKPFATMSKQLSASSRKEWKEETREAAEKLALAKQDLKSAKNELEAVQQSFNAQQEELKESYEKKKQDVMVKVVNLQSELEKMKTDTSIDARQATSKALANSINALIQRTTKSIACT